MQTNPAFAAIVLLAASSGSADAEGMVYKCRNAQGSLIYQESPCREDAQAVSSWAPSVTPAPQKNEDEGAKNGVYVVRQNSGGHYFLDGKINGKALTFMVDTGASAVSLPRSSAFLAQISCKDQVRLQTAGGAATGCTGIIATLRVGPFMIRNVPAVIVPNLDQPLLGMNVLSQFRIEQSNGEMRISLHDN